MAKYATRQSANKAKGPNQRVVQDGKGFKLVATNSLAGRASTTRTGIQQSRAKPVANSGKGTGSERVDTSTLGRIKRKATRRVSNATTAATSAATSAGQAVSGAATSAGKAVSGAASGAKKSVKRTAKRGVGAVRTGIATLKTKRLKAK